MIRVIFLDKGSSTSALPTPKTQKKKRPDRLIHEAKAMLQRSRQCPLEIQVVWVLAHYSFTTLIPRQVGGAKAESHIGTCGMHH